MLHVCLELRTHLGLAGNVQTSEYDGDRMSLLPCLSVKRATGMHMLGHLLHFRYITAPKRCSNPWQRHVEGKVIQSGR